MNGSNPRRTRTVADRILLKGGHVLSMDPRVGDIPERDVLIEGDAIADVGAGLSADAEVIDRTGDVVIPRFIDMHRHTWEAAIRSCAPNATLDDSFVDVLAAKRAEAPAS
jgi:cytosine/adenosine deaminase-related metal-dependent hydrolase